MIIPKDLFRLLPTMGILIFIALYVYATTLYPGGSQADMNSIGFDWGNNFWCNLTSENGINGLINPARPVAIFAMIILCSSMTVFFFLFAEFFVKGRFWKIAVKFSGALAMISAVFIFTEYHDVMTTILSVFGALVLIGIIRTLHIRNLTFFMISGIVCIVLIAINNFMYYNEDLIGYLPVIQKMNFVLVLSWTIGLNFKMRDNKLV